MITDVQIMAAMKVLVGAENPCGATAVRAALKAAENAAWRPSRELSANEIEVLEMLNGNRPGTWGAWVAACCESLKDRGYATGLYEITDAGRSALLAIHERKEP